MPAGLDWVWLQAVGLDCSTPYRGMAVAPHADATGEWGVHVASYRPATGRLNS